MPTTASIHMQKAKKSVKTSDKTFIASGGEGEVHTCDLTYPNVPITVIKLLHPHVRSATRTKKLLTFPPIANVIGPLDVGYDNPKCKGNAIAFSMESVIGSDPLFKFYEMDYAEQFTLQELIDTVAGLAYTAKNIHDAKGIIGDSNDLAFRRRHNITLVEKLVVMIDADTIGLPGFPCTAYTDAFLDPATDWVKGAPVLTVATDAWALALIAHVVLWGIGAFDGNHPTLSDPERMKKGVWVRHPDVVYPVALVPPWDMMPKVVNDYFEGIFVHGKRDPLYVVDWRSIEVYTCKNCGAQHANDSQCPYCSEPTKTTTSVSLPKTVPTRQRSKPISTQIAVSTNSVTAGGAIEIVFDKNPVVYADYHYGKLCYLYETDNGDLYRENGALAIPSNEWNQHSAFSFMGSNTLVCKPLENPAAFPIIKVFGPPTLGARQAFTHSWARKYPMIASDSSNFFVLDSQDRLVKNGSTTISRTVSRSRSWIKMGNHGLGLLITEDDPYYYAILFTANGQKVVQGNLPNPPGEVIAMDAMFYQNTVDRKDHDYVLFLRTEQRGGDVFNGMWLIDATTGTLIDGFEEDARKPTTIHNIRSFGLHKDLILTATGSGLTMLEVSKTAGSKFNVVKTWPDLVGDVPPGSRFLIAPNGAIFTLAKRRILKVNL